MLTKEEKIFSLNKELYRTIKDINNCTLSSSNDQKSLELARVIFSYSPSTFAYHCQVIALIRLSQFDKALELLEQQPSNSQLQYEKAYCYYRTLQLEKALETLDQLKVEQPQCWLRNKSALYHLQAQIFYTQERYTDTLDLYHQLVEWSGANEELQANILAANACLAMNHQKHNVDMIGEAISYENLYNMACVCLGDGQIAEAEKLLLQSRKLCSQSNITADEMEKELVVIATQLAYTLQLAGHKRMAMETYQSVLLSGLSDHLAVAIASTNALSIDPSKVDLFHIAKQLKPIHHLSPLFSQMKSFQRQKSLLNEAILQHLMRKTSNCLKIIHHHLTSLDDQGCLLFIATSSGKDPLKQQALLIEYAQERPTSILVHLALMQIQLQSNQASKALATLLYLLQSRTDKNMTIPIALSALLIWLLQKTGQTERANEILDGISDRLLTQCMQNVNTEEAIRLLKQIASFNLKSRRYQVAVEQYEFLVRLDPTDAQSMAGLITAYMVTDLQKADKYAATLPKVGIDHLDAEILEYSVPGSSFYIQNKTKVSNTTKKKRKPLLPKSLDKMPNPERWLPLSQRTLVNKQLEKKQK